MQQEATQVQAYVAGRIMQRLAKLGASEEPQLVNAIRAQVVNIPAPECNTAPTRHTRNISISKQIIRDTITQMGTTGQVRRFTYRKATFVALSTTTHQELVAAMQRTFGTFSVDIQTTLRGARIHPSAARKADTLSFFDTADRLHQSETEDGCLAIKSVTDPIAAEELPALNNVDFELYNESTPLSPEAAAKVAHQDRIGQGPRNTRRVEHARKQDWLQTPEGADWKRRKNAADTAKMDIILNDHPNGQLDNVLPESDDAVFSIAFA